MYSQIISVGYRNFPFALCVPFGKRKGKIYPYSAETGIVHSCARNANRIFR